MIYLIDKIYQYSISFFNINFYQKEMKLLEEKYKIKSF